MARAILSVSDKTGIVELARGLVALGYDIISTGGTARALGAEGVAVMSVSDVTGHPEILGGRVKTLHPAVHGGILARRDAEGDLRALGEFGYDLIDLVCVNLYPFEETVARGVSLRDAMEQVDIGGPTLLRAAAKNHAYVLPVVDPADYGRVLDALRTAVPDALRRELAAKVFAHTARYDGVIRDYLGEGEGEGGGKGGGKGLRGFPEEGAIRLRKVQGLRYGENPDQTAAFYAESGAPAGSLPSLRQLHGKELSFNNLIDIDAAVLCASEWAGEPRAACVVVKHTTPCGVALGENALEAYRRALATDPVSAFGGIVACTVPLAAPAAEAMADHFLEIIVAPAFEPEALEVLTRKKNLRLIELPVEAAGPGELDYKRVRGGLLVQTRLEMRFPEDEWRVVTAREPTEEEWRDLRFAWRVSAAVKSNAIVLVREERTLGLGAGQMSRVDSSRLAVMKAADQGLDLAGAALSSDAFFPFRDGVDAAAQAGARSIIQPGGSVRDAEVIAAADEHGMAMVFTGRRLFRH